MIGHISFSGIQEYCQDRQRWYRHYVKKIWDDKKPYAMIEGSGLHFIIENILKGQTYGQPLANAYIDTLDWTKINAEENPEELRDTLLFLEEQVLQFLEEHPIKAAQVEWKMESNKGLPIVLKGSIDCFDTNNRIIDWKAVTAFSSTTTPKPAYMLQACAYYILAMAAEQNPLKEVWYVEFKKTANRAKKGEEPKPQYQIIKIEIQDWMLKVFHELIDRIVAEIQGKSLIAEGKFIPNPFAFFGWEDGWYDFCEEILGYNPYTGEIKT